MSASPNLRAGAQNRIDRARTRAWAGPPSRPRARRGRQHAFFRGPLVLFVTLAGCTAASLGAADSPGGTTGGEGTGEAGDSVTPCRSASDCDDGVCDNGICVSPCTDVEDCPVGHYCSDASLCQPNNVPTCMLASDCVDGQICLEGYCSTPPSGSCNPGALDDGCGPRALCFERLDEDDVGDCYTMPGCASDGSCPVGASGAVCNEGYLFNKGRICLVGACVEEHHCPEGHPCVTADMVLGACSSGAFGSPCTEASHCNSGICNMFPGFVGYCG
jgi:hypothetical protein